MVVAGHEGGGGLEEGALIGGRYRVRRLLGRGGMGAVYEAEHVELGRLVALKTLLPQAIEDQKTSARLIQEGRAAAAIGHPGIVDVFDLVQEHGAAFVVMERLYGEELHERIQRCGPLPVAAVLRMGREVADAIAAAHVHGIIHCDLKPRNVFIAKDARLGEVFKVLDFGIAKLMHDADMRLSTHSNQVIGTPAYMAPERLAGELQVDGRADLYAIGALMYEALTARPPFEAASYPELVLRISSERPRSIAEQRQDVPAALIAVIGRALEKDPAARQASVAALAQELAASDVSAASDSSVRSALSADAATATVGQVAARKMPRRMTGAAAWKVAALATLLLASGVAGLRILRGSSRAPAPARSQIAPQAQAAGFDQTRGSLAAAPVPQRFIDGSGVAPSASPPSDPAHAGSATGLRRVRFETTPAKAVIWVDGKQRCASPCELEVPDRDLEVEAKLKGHHPARRTLSAPLPERLAIGLVPRQTAAAEAAHEQADGLPPLLPR